VLGWRHLCGWPGRSPHISFAIPANGAYYALTHDAPPELITYTQRWPMSWLRRTGGRNVCQVICINRESEARRQTFVDTDDRHQRRCEYPAEYANIMKTAWPCRSPQRSPKNKQVYRFVTPFFIYIHNLWVVGRLIGLPISKTIDTGDRSAAGLGIPSPQRTRWPDWP